MHESVPFCKGAYYVNAGANMIMHLTVCGCYDAVQTYVKTKLGQKYYGISRNCL